MQKTILLYNETTTEAVKIVPDTSFPKIIKTEKPAKLAIPDDEEWVVYTKSHWQHIPKQAQSIKHAADIAIAIAEVYNITFRKANAWLFKVFIENDERIRELFGNDAIQFILKDDTNKTYTEMVHANHLYKVYDSLAYFAERNRDIFKNLFKNESSKFKPDSVIEGLLFSIIAKHENKTVYLETNANMLVKIEPVQGAFPKVSSIPKNDISGTELAFETALYFALKNDENEPDDFLRWWKKWFLLNKPEKQFNVEEVATSTKTKNKLEELFDTETQGKLKILSLSDVSIDECKYRLDDVYQALQVEDETEKGVKNRYKQFAKWLHPDKRKNILPADKVYLDSLWLKLTIIKQCIHNYF